MQTKTRANDGGATPRSTLSVQAVEHGPLTMIQIAIGPLGVAHNRLDVEYADDSVTVCGWRGSGVTVHDVEDQ